MLRPLFFISILLTVFTSCGSGSNDSNNPIPNSQIDIDTGLTTTDVGVGDLGGSVFDTPPSTCSDGIQNLDESDIDCGGSCDARCAVGLACADASDCASGLCVLSTCQGAPSCDDSQQNGTETDVDCGGSACAECTTGQQCLAASDCETEVCGADLTCSEAACGDGVVNDGAEDCDDQGESATCNIDCTTAACGDGVVNASAGEVCDDGNQIDTDLCRNDCTGNDFFDDFESGAFRAEWNLSGDTNWFASSNQSIAGTYSAESGDIDNNDSSRMSLTVMCYQASFVTFDYVVSSEFNRDFLRITIDDAIQVSESGMKSGSLSFAISAGLHTVDWIYFKDNSRSLNLDTAWIDNVSLPNCVAQ